MPSIAYANQARFDGKGVVCPAESAVASDAEAEYGWSPEAAIFWFDDGKVTQIKNVTDKDITLFDKTLKSADYYSNETELWFDLGYTYSFNLKTSQLFWVISMGGDTKLRNKACRILDGDIFWESSNSSPLRKRYQVKFFSRTENLFYII